MAHQSSVTNSSPIPPAKMRKMLPLHHPNYTCHFFHHPQIDGHRSSTSIHEVNRPFDVSCRGKSGAASARPIGQTQRGWTPNFIPKVTEARSSEIGVVLRARFLSGCKRLQSLGEEEWICCA